MLKHNKANQLVLLFLFFLTVSLTACTKPNFIAPKNADNNIDVSVQPEPGEVAIIDSDIMVTKPLSNDTIFNPVEITGRARISQGSIFLRLKDGWDNIIATSTIKLEDNSGNDWGYYTGQLEFNTPTSPAGWLEVYSQNTQDGSEQNLIKLPVAFKDYSKPVVKVYFNNTKDDPKMKNCSVVYPVNREVDFNNQLAIAALSELFKGPSEQELKDGFLTNLPKEEIKVQKLEYKDNKVYIDFNQALQQDVKGACKTSGIRAQITETLKQFPNISEVILSIDGQTDGILKP
ncbi:MAG: GerMN domain-containing protein [Patescibacteria group bacterium]